MSEVSMNTVTVGDRQIRAAAPMAAAIDAVRDAFADLAAGGRTVFGSVDVAVKDGAIARDLTRGFLT
jgi:hypothetical protein